jgi:hypothetical protein
MLRFPCRQHPLHQLVLRDASVDRREFEPLADLRRHSSWSGAQGLRVVFNPAGYFTERVNNAVNTLYNCVMRLTKEPVMTTQEDTIIVFTARSPEQIVGEGGSQSWVLKPMRAKNCQWLVCTLNRHNPDYELWDATVPHGAGFLIGKVSGIRPSQEGVGDRWLIAISEFARVNIPDLWDHGRNPVRYTSLEALGIDPNKLKWEPVQQVPKDEADTPTPFSPSAPGSAPGLTIAEAKKALAATFGVSPEAVEITIRV